MRVTVTRTPPLWSPHKLGRRAKIAKSAAVAAAVGDAPLGCSNESSNSCYYLLGGYLARLSLAWLDLLVGCRFIIISAAHLADAFQSCLCARAAQTSRVLASEKSNYVKESL